MGGRLFPTPRCKHHGSVDWSLQQQRFVCTRCNKTWNRAQWQRHLEKIELKNKPKA